MPEIPRTDTVKPGDTVHAYALFALPPVEAEVKGIEDGQVTIEFDGRTTTVRLAQIVGTPEYDTWLGRS